MENNLTTDDRKAFKLFGIESAIIILLIIVIVVVLSVLNVIPYRSFIPGLSNIKVTPTFTPENNAYFDAQRKLQMERIKAATPNQNLPADISIVSDIPSVSAEVTNKEGLIKLLREWGIYGRVYQASVYAKGSMGTKPLEKIVIHVTDKVQQANQYAKDIKGQIYSSSYTNLTPGQMDIYIQVDTSASSLDKQVLFQLVNMVTKMASPADGKEQIDARNKIIETRYAPLRSEDIKYFNVTSA